jgi:hypothetical protein
MRARLRSAIHECGVADSYIPPHCVIDAFGFGAIPVPGSEPLTRFNHSGSTDLLARVPIKRTRSL